MNEITSKLDDEIQLYCDFGRHGWGELVIVQNGKCTAFSVSDVFSDFAYEVCEICRAALENRSLRVALCDEPGGVVIEVKAGAEQQHTMLFSVFEVDGSLSGFGADEEGRLVLSSRIRRRRLVGMLLSELWKTHSFLREPSYQKNRQSFPHRDVIELNRLWEESPLGPSFLK